MKIIAHVDGETFIAQFTRDEIQKYINDYDYTLNRFHIGSEIDLRRGYDYLRDIRKISSKLIEAKDEFNRNSETLFKFAEIVINQNEKEGNLPQ